MGTFDYKRFLAEVNAVRRGSYQQIMAFIIPVGALPAAGTPGSSAAYPAQLNLPGPVNTFALMPSLQVDPSQPLLISSVTAIVMVRFNGVGPWLPFSFSEGMGTGFTSFTGTIFLVEYYIAAPDTQAGGGQGTGDEDYIVVPQLVGIAGVNVAGSIPGVGGVGNYGVSGGSGSAGSGGGWGAA